MALLESVDEAEQGRRISQVMKKKRSIEGKGRCVIIIVDDTVACYAGINVSVRQVGVSGWAGVFGCHLRCLQGLIWTE